METKRCTALYNKAKTIIPGGTQLLSKRPERFLPELWPAYYEKAKGTEVWDLDGNRYVDMTIMGVGCSVLGYADEDVDMAVSEAMAKGNMCTLNAPEEVSLAQLLCQLHPWSDMVRFARTGGEAMAISVRIARAAQKKDKVLFCGYHGWHDWYLSANLANDSSLDGHLLEGLKPLGVPRGLTDTAKAFEYNNIRSFRDLISTYEGEIAAVVMEPVRGTMPQENFLEEIRETTKKKNIVLIFDEVTSGFRVTPGGIHMDLGVQPDIAVFAKAMGNGYPVAAIIGRGPIMTSAGDSFISSTYWTDRLGPAAAIATIKKYIKHEVSSHLIHIGNLVQNGWKQISEHYDLNIHVSGIPPLGHWKIQTNDSQMFHTVIVKEMLERGFLTSNSFYASYAHDEAQVESYLKNLFQVIGMLQEIRQKNPLRDKYNIKESQIGFTRLN